MANRPWDFRRIPSASIFVKLFFIFLVTAVALVVVIRGNFQLALDRSFDKKDAVAKNLVKYATQLVDEIGSPPNRDRATRLAEELKVQFRVETPGEAWTTDPSLPPLSALKVNETVSDSTAWVGRNGKNPFVVLERNSVRYGVFFALPSFRELPTWSFVLLVGPVILILGASYLLVRRLFRPVNWLMEGVSEITKGNFSHQVPIRSKDELARLTKAFNEMAHRVHEMIRARDRLLLDVSHELRSPLTRMKITVEFVQNAAAKDKLQQEIREVEAMVTELLESERLDSTYGGITQANTDLVALVRDLAETYSLDGPGVRVMSAPSDAWAKLDGQRVRVALRNVLENALNYSGSGCGPVEVRVEKGVSTVRVSVRDRGPGVPAEEQPLIFEPFYRVDKSRTRSTGGYGLGLSLAKKIMTAHGGDILLTSEPGQGSTFTLRFPLT